MVYLAALQNNATETHFQLLYACSLKLSCVLYLFSDNQILVWHYSTCSYMINI